MQGSHTEPWQMEYAITPEWNALISIAIPIYLIKEEWRRSDRYNCILAVLAACSSAVWLHAPVNRNSVHLTLWATVNYPKASVVVNGSAVVLLENAGQNASPQSKVLHYLEKRKEKWLVDQPRWSLYFISQRNDITLEIAFPIFKIQNDSSQAPRGLKWN